VGSTPTSGTSFDSTKGSEDVFRALRYVALTATVTATSVDVVDKREMHGTNIRLQGPLAHENERGMLELSGASSS